MDFAEAIRTQTGNGMWQQWALYEGSQSQPNILPQLPATTVQKAGVKLSWPQTERKSTGSESGAKLKLKRLHLERQSIITAISK